jgi:Tol biopolymer transport system component
LAWRVAVWVGLTLACLPAVAGAQYFGRNKVQYRTFDFQVLKTEHFDLYYYPEEAEAAGIVSRMAERWYSRFSRFFEHQLRSRQAVILYAAPAHFRQTNVIEGLIGEGTGGVTEAIKRRIVLPVSGSLADTDHVLGHELVHAFQFDLTGDDPRGNPGTAPGILAFPLWFVEGMAEYLSLGPVDAQTAMWLRDAALREKLPGVKDLDDPKYFPYRWGHAFWAFVGAKYGDRAVASLIRSAANPRFDLMGLARQLGSTPDDLDAAWHDAIMASTREVAAGRSSIESSPRMIVNRTTGSGRYNVGPRLSPDGRQVAFFSERDLFSIDLFIADAETGRIVHKLENSATDPHFDSLEFLDSAGAWSPDGRWLAITAVRSGHPVVALLDPHSGSVKREVPLPGLDDAINPSFAPDGKSLVLSGNQGGLMDLYVLSLDSGRLDRLTHDPFADLEPTFTPDGKSIVFVTERFSTDLATLVSGPLRLARLDLATRAVTAIPGFLEGKHLSPQVSADGRTLTFVAEPGGVSNLYRMAIDGGPIEQVSSFLTGVAGITSSSPALSSAGASGRLAFSVFEDDGQSIYLLDPSGIATQVPPAATEHAALLPGRATPGGEVERLLTDSAHGLPALTAKPESSPYRDHLSLDAIGQPSVGVGVSSFGGYVGGSISFLFGDTLGDRALGVAASINGTFADFGGQFIYANRRHRWNWAASIEQMPYRSEYLTLVTPAGGTTTELADVIQRQISRGVFGLAAYPLNRATRLEFSGGGRSLSFTQEVQTGIYDTASGVLQSRTVTKSTLADPINTAEGSAALVHDTSYFGATSPLYGERYRLEIDRSMGTLNYTGLLIDWRRYFMPRRPITVAFRALHYGRYGTDAEDPRLVPLYAGYPDLVHGYGFGSFTSADCVVLPNGTTQCGVFQSLEGSRMFVGNVEVRAPLLGLFRGDIQYGRIPVEVAGFFDAGVTWSRNTRPAFLGGTQDLLRSYGGAARVNVFGFLVVEAAVSHPMDRLNGRWYWQLGLRQGF